MPTFGEQSKKQLATCDSRLQRLFNEVIKIVDCKILEGHRGQQAQDAAYYAHKSQKKWPTGRHNKLPSMAVDAAPYPINWSDTKRFREFAKIVLDKADELNINVRWGGDWDSDPKTPNHFDDLVHFEIPS